MKTAYLGQFTDENANRIAGELERAHIPWMYKQASWVTKVLFLGEWGTRLFVDSTRLDEAKRIAEDVMSAPGSPDD